MTTAQPETREAPGPAAGSRRYVTAALMLLMVLASMESTVTSTAMPTIIGALHGLEHYSWVFTAYLLASTIVMPLYGRVADILGRKRVIIFAVLLFTAGSISAAFCRSMPQLILCRSIQGLGAGGIMPVVLTILGDIFTIEERARIQGAFSAVWGTASLAGPALGAFLVKTLGWPSIFWINLPAGFLGLIVLIFCYHDREKPHSTDLDLPGIFSLAVGSTALLAALSLSSGTTVDWYIPVLLFAVAAVSLNLFRRIERTARNPILPPALMFHRAIGPAVLASGLLGLGVFAIDTYVPLFVQGGRGGDATAAAATVTPVMLAWAGSSFLAAPLMMRWGFRKTAVVGGLLILVGYLGVLAAALFNLPLWCLTAVLLICGCGFGPASMSMLLSAQDATTWQQRGVVTSSITFARAFGGALGVGLLGALFNLLMAPHLMAMKASHLTPADLLDAHRLKSIPPQVLHPAQQAIAHSLLWVFASMLLFALVQVLVSLAISRHKSAHRLTAGETIESAV